MLRITPNVRRILFAYAILSFCIALAGCGLAWLNTIQSVIPIATGMVLGIISLIAALSGKTLSADEVTAVTNGATEVETALTDVQNAVEAYQANPGTSTITDLENVMGVAIAAANKFLTDIHVTDPATQAKFVAIMQLVLTEIESVATLLPVLKANAGQVVTITIPVDSKTFKTLYNEVISQPTGNVQVDAACAKLKRL